jgi:hypothetical protein
MGEDVVGSRTREKYKETSPSLSNNRFDISMAKEFLVKEKSWALRENFGIIESWRFIFL